MFLHRKAVIVTTLAFLLTSSVGLCRPPLGDDKARTEIPADLQGVKVYHLPAKSQKSKGDLAVVRSVAYQEVNIDHLALNLLVRMNPVDRAATVVKVYFQDLQANGLPVHVEPYDTPFRLSKTEAVALPSPLRMTFVFAEMSSLDPLRRLVSQDTLHLSGQLFILVQLNTLEAVVMRTRQLVLPFNFDQTVPMHAFGDEPMIQSAVLRLLDSLSAPYSLGATALAQQRQKKLETERAIAAATAGRVFLVYCAYSVRNPKTHDVQRYTQSGTAFLVDAGGTLLTARRVVQPWKFDPQVASLISQSGYEFEPGSYRVAVWPADAKLETSKGELDLASALSTDRHTLEIWKVSPETTEPKPGVSAEGANDLALLKMVGQSTTVTPLAAASPAEAPASAILLGFPFGTDQERAKLQQSSVTFDSRLQAVSPRLMYLARALNPGESGGPLVTAEGKVIAVCSGPKACAPLAAALRSLETVTALAVPAVSGGSKDLKEMTVRFDTERREMLVLSLEEVNESLGAAKHNLPPEGVWQTVTPGGTLYTFDAARVKLQTYGDKPPQASQVAWSQRSSPDSPWEALGTGLEVAFNVAPHPGSLMIRAEVANGKTHFSSAPVQYESRRRLCLLLHKTMLDDIALGTATFREAKSTTKTYKEVAAGKGKILEEIALIPDPDDPQNRPYQLANGDVVLRTGGPMGYVQRSLGSPQSPQNHSGLITIDRFQDKNVYMVNEIGWGYEYTPLTPADAAAYQEMKSLPQRPESFLEGANVGTIEVYRPVGVVERSEGGATAWQSYPIGEVAAKRVVELGAKAQLGYDFLFMETSPIADQPPFEKLYYCHELTREAFGRKMTSAAPIPILQELWKAARVCDKEMAAANAAGTAGDPGTLATVLSQIDVEHITFDPDATTNEAIRKEFRELINSLQRFLSGEPFEEILKSKVAGQVETTPLPTLADALLKGTALGPAVVPILQRLLSDLSLAELAKNSGLPPKHAALLGAAFSPAIQAWVAASRMGAAKFLTEDLYEDLGTAIDAKSLLTGGEATGANGEPVRVTFKRISAPMP